MAGSVKIAFALIGIGVYFIGHPLYPIFVPLINAYTPWMTAVGSVYIIIGSFSISVSKTIQYRFTATWIIGFLGIGISALTISEISEILDPHNLVALLLVGFILAAMFPLGYSSQLRDKKQFLISLLFVCMLYSALLINSVNITERVRGPVGAVFIGFGCVGILLGLPAYLLGASLAPPRDVVNK